MADTIDRGTPCRIWFCVHDDAFFSFSPFPGALGYVLVSVPIGWKLAVTPQEESGLKFGAVLERTDGRWLIGQEVVLWANRRHDGFRNLGEYRYPVPLDSYQDLDPARRRR